MLVTYLLTAYAIMERSPYVCHLWGHGPTHSTPPQLFGPERDRDVTWLSSVSSNAKVSLKKKKNGCLPRVSRHLRQVKTLAYTGYGEGKLPSPVGSFPQRSASDDQKHKWPRFMAHRHIFRHVPIGTCTSRSRGIPSIRIHLGSTDPEVK